MHKHLDRELFPYIKEMDEKPAFHKDGQVYVHGHANTFKQEIAWSGFKN